MPATKPDTKTAHTPGPWKLVIRDATFDIVGADGVNVLKTSWHSTIRDRYPLKAEALANALLATAATDMLAALRSAELAVEELCHGQDPANQCWVILAEIRAAIAKAEGRQP